MQNSAMFREILNDHYANPRNHGLLADKDYITVHLKNPSCGDDLTIQFKLNGEEIEDIRQEVSGCAICCASASIMSELLKAKTVSEAEAIIHEFRLMVSAEPFDDSELDEALCLQGVSQVPPRIKCASLAWLALQEGLDNLEQFKEHKHNDENNQDNNEAKSV